MWCEGSNTSSKAKSLASRTIVRASVPQNRAAGQALADSMTNAAANFGKGGKGEVPGDNPPSTKGNGKKGGGKDPKPKKVPRYCQCVVFVCVAYFYLVIGMSYRYLHLLSSATLVLGSTLHAAVLQWCFCEVAPIVVFLGRSNPQRRSATRISMTSWRSQTPRISLHV